MAHPLFQPDLRASFGEMPEGTELPEDPRRMAELATALVMPEVERVGIDRVEVVCLRGRSWERWQLRGPMPASLDGMVRAICEYGAPVSGVAVARKSQHEEHDADLPAVRIVGELGGHRSERVYTYFQRADGPGVQPSRTYSRDLGRVPDGDGWIGVPSGLPFGITALGAFPE